MKKGRSAKTNRQKSSPSLEKVRLAKADPVSLLGDRPVRELWNEHVNRKNGKKTRNHDEILPSNGSTPELEHIRKEISDADDSNYPGTPSPVQEPVQIQDLEQEKQKLSKENRELGHAAAELRQQLEEVRIINEKNINKLREEIESAHQSYHELLTKINAVGISEIDLKHVMPGKELEREENDLGAASSSLFTIRMYNTSEGIIGVLHHPVDRAKLSIRGVDGDAISSFISRHISKSAEEAHKKKETELLDQVVTETEINSTEGENTQSEEDTLEIGFKQNQAELPDGMPLLWKSAFKIKVTLKIPELSERAGIPTNLSFCSLWLGLRKADTGGFFLQESRALKLTPKSPDLHTELSFKGLEKGEYVVNCRATLPYLSRMLKKKIEFSVAEVLAD
ncbi:MAG TPA: hypothetical protein PKI90_02100 [bacterium]|nr:hypothetical protein [bacterium]